MASFCAQCSIDVYGKDYGDYRGLITAEQFAEGWVVSVICEDCGHCVVDHEGRCVGGCMKGHGLAAAARRKPLALADEPPAKR
jgi:hypothetical protein